MSKELVIVESPTKARTIGRILPGKYQVTASNGHVRDLPERKFGIDIKKDFAPQYEVTANRKKMIQELKAAAKKAEAIYLATDPDREGEAIAWHIYELLKQEAKKGTAFRRVTFHEITRSAVEEAFSHPGELNMDRVNAQQARRVLDRIVGYQVSPLLWQKVERGTSAGRVQSVALRLICERERAIQAFTPEEYWNLSAHFAKLATDEAFVARLVEVDDAKAEVTSGEQAAAIAADAEKAGYAVSKVQKTPMQRRAQPPFITSTLQQAASANLRFSPDATMRVAQQLYEGVDTGSGPSGLITYMRTDSVNISKEAQGAARAYIGETFGADYVPEKPNVYRSRGGAQEAHEAIRPTDIQLTPEKAARYLDDGQLKLYRLIWNRFLASQMAPARQLRYTVEVSSQQGTSEHAYLFRATSTMTTFPGYLKVYNLHDVEEEDEQEAPLPELALKDGCRLTGLDKEQKFTQPPPRFSEAMLVRELEKNGIGRPSTYASIVKTIQQREYTRKEQGKMVPTELGFSVIDYLVGTMPKLFEVDFTARMESELDDVESGSREWHEMLADFYGRFNDWLVNAKADGPDLEVVRKLIGAFPDVDAIAWEKPTKRGKRTYDDRKFFVSLREQLDAGKEFSGRQWEALLQLAVRYEAALPDLQEILAGHDELLAQLATLQADRQKRAEEKPAEATLQMMRALDQVAKWEAPVTRGKRTYDDETFFRSLKERTDSGRPLTPPQLKALMRLVVKYREQVPGYDAFKETLELPPEPVTVEVDKANVDAAFALFEEIKTWEPPRGKGPRRFDDQAFIQSLRQQHQQGRAMSERQWSALQKVLGRYASQIDNFEARAVAIGLTVNEPDKPEKTEVPCPKCEQGVLVRRTYRKRLFYGCEHYPKCDYSTRSLDKLSEPKSTK